MYMSPQKKLSKPVVSVFIPAHNEESNIGHLIRSLLHQDTSRFRLSDITVCLDGSIDNTRDIVRAIAQKSRIKIRMTGSSHQLGKYERLNRAFRTCTAEILIVLDADITIQGSRFIENMVAPLLKDPHIEILAAHQKLFRPHGVMARILYTSFLYWDHVRLSVPNIHSHHNYYGSATAYRGSFARRIKMPKGLCDPHMYIYIRTVERTSFRYTFNAVMYQWPISTWSDLQNFLKRTIGKGDPFIERRYPDAVRTITPVPLVSKIKGLMKTLTDEPFFTLPGIFISVYIKFMAKRIHPDSTSLWQTAVSTKKSPL